jgi:hypothetical protein
LRVSFLKRFRGQCRLLRAPDQAGVLRALMDLETALANPQEHRGLGLRKLHPSGIWEIRVGLSLRALFRLLRFQARKARGIISEFAESRYQRALLAVTDLVTDRDH